MSAGGEGGCGPIITLNGFVKNTSPHVHDQCLCDPKRHLLAKVKPEWIEKADRNVQRTHLEIF